jgi:hypothetical protein
MDLTQAGIGAVALTVAGLFVALQHRAGAALGESPQRRRTIAAWSAGAASLWLLLWFALASTGLFRQVDARPPPFMIVFAGTVAMGLGLGLSGIGRRLAAGLPIWILIAAQGFRLPLEWVMHQAYERGVMPVQMSWSGWNFDVVTGVLALAVGALAAKGRAPRWLLLLWTVLAFVTLFVVAGIALASTPLFHAFGSAPEQLNTWVADPPYVWLPTVMVAFALAGQLVVVRKLRSRPA